MVDTGTATSTGVVIHIVSREDCTCMCTPTDADVDTPSRIGTSYFLRVDLHDWASSSFVRAEVLDKLQFEGKSLQNATVYICAALYVL